MIGLMAITLPASAHTDEEIEAFFTDLEARREVIAKVAPRGVDVDALFAEIIADMIERHPCSHAAGTWVEACNQPVVEATPRHQPVSDTVNRSMGSGVEQWRGLVAAYFPGGEVDRALCIMSHESGGNPNARNPSSGAAGLFQVMPFWWDHYGGDRYDPETNVAVARLIWDQQYWGGWSPYNRGLCH